jgi:hypothetical protein
MSIKVSLEKALSFDYHNKYNLEKLLEFKKFVSVVKMFHPCTCECTVDEGEDDKYSFDYGNVYLTNDICKIIINQYNNKSNYNISLDERFDNLTNYDIQNIKENFTEPKKIGVLSTKKINDWVEYQQKVYLACKEKNEEKSNVVSSFLKSIEKEDVKWWDNKTQGEIIKNGIVFKFKIETGYVSTKIEIDYHVNYTLENFKKLADNKYTK